MRTRFTPARIVLDLAEVTPHVSGPDTVQVMQSVAEIAKKKIAIQKAYLVSCVNSRLEDLAAAANVLRGKKVADGVKFYLAAASRSVQEEAEKRGIWQTLLDAGAQPLPSGMRAVHRAGHRIAGGRRGRHLRHQSQFQGPHGLARCAVLSRQPGSCGGVGGRGLHLRAGPSCRYPHKWHIEFASSLRRPSAGERRDSCPDFPPAFAGRLVFLPQDNLNTDGIYGKDYTYREDMTPEMMAQRRDGELRSAICGANARRATLWSAASTSAPAPVASRP